MVNCAATTSKARGKHGEGLTALALQLCEQLQIPVIARNNKGIPWLLGQYQLDCLLVEEEHTLVLHWSDGQQLFFHPGMAVPRIKQLKDGKGRTVDSGIGCAEWRYYFGLYYGNGQ